MTGSDAPVPGWSKKISRPSDVIASTQLGMDGSSGKTSQFVIQLETNTRSRDLHPTRDRRHLSRNSAHSASPRTLRKCKPRIGWSFGVMQPAETKCSSRIRCHHLLKTFWGWRDQQLPTARVIIRDTPPETCLTCADAERRWPCADTGHRCASCVGRGSYRCGLRCTGRRYVSLSSWAK